MNVLMLLKPKKTVQFVYDYNTLRQGLERMRAHSYTALPVITSDGKYAGTVSEGDFLYYILDRHEGGMRSQEKYNIRDILRTGFNPAVKISVPASTLRLKSTSRWMSFWTGLKTRTLCLSPTI